MSEGRKRLSSVPTTAAPSDGATIIVNDDGIKQVPRSAILQGALNADAINYNNASSGLSATDVQGAVDELDGIVDGLVTHRIKSVTFNRATDDYGNLFLGITKPHIPIAVVFDNNQVRYQFMDTGANWYAVLTKNASTYQYWVRTTFTGTVYYFD